VESNDDRVGLGATGTGFFLACVVAAIAYAWLARVPLPEESVRIVPTGSLLAYTAEGDTPLVLVRGKGRLELVLLRRNWRPVLGLDVPSWRLGGPAIGLPGTTDPASLFVLGCAAVDEICDRNVTLVGQVNGVDVAFMEVAIDGSWHRFFTRFPGFVKLLPRGVRVGDVRWLARDRQVVWALDRNEDGRIAPLLLDEGRSHSHARFSGQG
jgi:hypothetical protein